MAIRRTFASLLKAPHPRRKDALSPGYWEALGARITSIDLPAAGHVSVDTAARGALIRGALIKEGYCRVPQVLDPRAAALLRACVDLVLVEEWPAVFALALAPAWTALSWPGVRAAIDGLMGEGARVLPRLWVHRVEAGGAGWEPHADYPGDVEKSPDGTPHRMTLWLALSHAHPGTGCMHLIPRDAVSDVTRAFATLKEVKMEDAVRLLHASRAVPADEGDALAWDFSTVHWGSAHTTQGAPPRTALSLELLHRDAAPQPDDTPLLDVVGVPPTRLRLMLVGRALEVFGGRHARAPDAAPFMTLARDLISLW